MKIKEGVYWVGVKDPKLRIFDVIMQAEAGTTYNSYLIIGSEKVALIDTVKESFKDEFLKKVSDIVPLEKIDYLVLNHLEPDHSGAVPYILEKSNPKVVVSKNAQMILKELLHRDVNPMLVGDGDRISLGDKTLEFIHAPFLHWPDTMFTYLVEDAILFPCDFLGCHYCDDAIFNDETLDFSFSFKHYFFTIMRPFKDYAYQAIKKIENRKIDIIAPSHGPILRKDPWHYVELYRQWSEPKKRETRRAVIFYASPYGGTGLMAKNIARGLMDSGVKAEIFDLSGTSIDDNIIDIIEDSDALIVGSSTINGDAIKPVWILLASLATINLRNKIGFAFGTYAWSGEAAKMIENRMKDLKMKVPEPFLRAQMIPTEEDLKKSYETGKKLADIIKSSS
ncbi:MAG: FprA family A-type flavoprotein [Thermoplasmata archaeon]|jgi:flavorubredoxin|nr:FprA family A-type flavoprotein [Thermoplasmatales archaeon]PMP75850.1 MAG: MBL fold metallo-hydrolase [Aciduliprofundum sp.]HEU12807.1 FprA family A-type flavoprotein [Euryarchaeota archaeon]